MKSHTKRIRRLRRLALAGCIVAVVAPTSANAMLPDRGPDRVQSQQQQYSLPSNFRTEVQTVAQQYSPPSGFRTEVQTSAPQPSPAKPIVLRRTAPPSATPTVASAPNPTLIRVESVTESSNTLWIVLASVAIAIALCSLAYATIRVSRMQHRELGSH
ncbi:MAG TPA: hypothetical protein VH247_11095 [Thermoleophilaceae bacterium]|jgi:hypothetical protein|nr:hypothetical protein [Thermoleophilaceae bacterium]